MHCTSKTSALRDVEDAFKQAKDDHYDREAEKKETGTHTLLFIFLVFYLVKFYHFFFVCSRNPHSAYFLNR